MTLTDDFKRFVCQTSPFANGLQIARAEGCYIYDEAARQYLDFIAGIAVVNVGHCHPEVVEAVERQAKLFAHTMVYGEHVQRPQVELACEIASVAPEGLDTTYFLTTGAEANDAALKMAVKLTGRKNICAFERAYHGDTVGALACFGDEHFRAPFAAILPHVDFLRFGNLDDLNKIGRETAAVLVEPVQGEAGIHVPDPAFLRALRTRCTETSAMLIFDEVQTGFGRVGDWFAAKRFNVTPDAITVAKGMGAGMPLAGVIGPHDALNRFASDPPFSHITTFGGHPVCCAAGLAGMRVIKKERLLDNANEQGSYLISKLMAMAETQTHLRKVRGIGLMIGVETASPEFARKVVTQCKARGLILETTLLDESVIRFSPPLIVTREQCDAALAIFAAAIEV